MPSHHDHHDDDHDLGFAHDLPRLIGRRRLLGVMGGLGLVAVAAPASALECVALPWEPQGPYPADGSNSSAGQVVNVLTQEGVIRQDIRSSFGDFTGTADGPQLDLELVLLGADGCTPLVGHAIYVWHCDPVGEVMGWDRNFPRAFLKAQLGAGTVLPSEGQIFISIKDADKTPELAAAARDLVAMGFGIIATSGTADFLAENGVAAQRVNKVYEGRPNIVDRLKNDDIAMVLNTTEGAQAINDSREIRAVALYDKIPYFTTAAGSIAAVAAIKSRGEGEVGVRPRQA